MHHSAFKVYCQAFLYDFSAIFCAMFAVRTPVRAMRIRMEEQGGNGAVEAVHRAENPHASQRTAERDSRQAARRLGRELRAFMLYIAK